MEFVWKLRWVEWGRLTLMCVAFPLSSSMMHNNLFSYLTRSRNTEASLTCSQKQKHWWLHGLRVKVKEVWLLFEKAGWFPLKDTAAARNAGTAARLPPESCRMCSRVSTWPSPDSPHSRSAAWFSTEDQQKDAPQEPCWFLARPLVGEFKTEQRTSWSPSLKARCKK